MNGMTSLIGKIDNMGILSITLQADKLWITSSENQLTLSVNTENVVKVGLLLVFYE